MNETQALTLLTNTVRRKHLALSTERISGVVYPQAVVLMRWAAPSWKTAPHDTADTFEEVAMFVKESAKDRTK